MDTSNEHSYSTDKDIIAETYRVFAAMQERPVHTDKDDPVYLVSWALAKAWIAGYEHSVPKPAGLSPSKLAHLFTSQAAQLLDALSHGK